MIIFLLITLSALVLAIKKSANDKAAPAPDPKYIIQNGYLAFRDSGRFVHRWAMEKKIGRKLIPGEVVHHVDGHKLNNSPQNLWLFSTQEQHQRYHREQLSMTGNWYGHYGK
ncbi:MAG: HNH endonuclease signature motif containing protein [Bacillota bacterium]